MAGYDPYNKKNYEEIKKLNENVVELLKELKEIKELLKE